MDDNADGSLLVAVYHYLPQKSLAATAAVVYAALAVALSIPLYRTRSWWGLCLPIGAACSSLGYIIRIIAIISPSSLSVFILTQMFIVCSPASFLAFNYILYGRLVAQCIKNPKHSLIHPRRVGTIFVISDISTFIVQASGGGMEAISNVNIQKLGRNLLFAGLVLQSVSYFLFMGLFARAHWSVRKDAEVTGKEKWWVVFKLLYYSSFFISIRATYRIIELIPSESNGALVTHEIYFYLLDGLPLALAIACYVPFWPCRYLEPKLTHHEIEFGLMENRGSTRKL